MGPWHTAVAAAIGVTTLAKLEYVTAPETSSTSSASYKIVANNFYKYPGVKGYPLDIGFTGPFYYAAILSALAATEADSLKPANFAKYIYEIRTKSPGSTEVQTFAQGKAALAAGKKIYFFGASGNFGWTPTHSIIQPVIVYHLTTSNSDGPTLFTLSVSQMKAYLGSK